MHKTLRSGIAIGILLALGQATEAKNNWENAGDLEIAVRVYNYARIRNSVLAKARANADAIYGKVGIAIRWYDCTRSATEPGSQPECEARRGPAQISLMIKPETMPSSWSQSEHELGSALLSDDGSFGSYAYVFYSRVEKHAKQTRRYLTGVLGLALAHEMGHLLLGIHGHSRGGLMKAVWSRKDLARAETGALVFSVADGKRLRANVGERLDAFRQLARR